MEELLFYNGYGGFDRERGEYVIDAPGVTPAPWINCITCVSGKPFGFTISDAGGGFVFSGNSQKGRLTPWHCQTVRDPVNETITVTAENGTSFDCIPRVREDGDSVRFGKGYAVFTRARAWKGAMCSTLTVYAAAEERVKCSELALTPQRDATVTVRYRVRLEGFVPDLMPARHIEHGCVLRDQIFVTCSVQPDRIVCEAGTVALLLSLRVRAGETLRLTFYLGENGGAEGENGDAGEGESEPDRVPSLAAVRDGWRDILERIRVSTPEPAVDLLLNGWLLYQVRSCRLNGRSGHYQSGGAYGFRDQLQDVLAFLYTEPARVREQILLHASRQYEEGDVQHWWHPPLGDGVRTRCSDDLLWLVYAASEYVRASGDAAFLRQPVPFLHSAPLSPKEEDRYETPAEGESGSVGTHLRRAVLHALRFGAHGLPLIGSCDWNDGFSRVGAQGRGESVWLSWFLQDCIARYAELAELFDPDGAEERKMLRGAAEALRRATEQSAWDGDRYLRAFCDDGTPLGAADGRECAVDSLTQSWATVSRCADPGRAARCLDTAMRSLADLERGVIRLLAPPFSDPSGVGRVGYIAAYPPGVRENGGQYTHAALWLAKALLMRGDGARGYAVLEALNPISHTRSAHDVRRYRAEPYVMSADVYYDTPSSALTGRAGWSWYTGSAAWMYRVLLEDLLGFTVRRESGAGCARCRVRVKPCLPPAWERFELTYRFGTAQYVFAVENGADGSFDLEDDGREHRIVVRKR